MNLTYMKEADVEGIRPKQVHVYLPGSEMGDANLEAAKTIRAAAVYISTSHTILGTSMCIHLSQ